MEIAVFIQNIQEERGEVALHIFSQQPFSNISSRHLTERFQMTDRALEEVPTWPNVSHNHTSNTDPHFNINNPLVVFENGTLVQYGNQKGFDEEDRRGFDYRSHQTGRKTYFQIQVDVPNPARGFPVSLAGMQAISIYYFTL